MTYPQNPYSNYPDWTSAHDPDAPWNQPDPRCETCEQPETDCTCPVCLKCGEIGNPDCCEGDE